MPQLPRQYGVRPGPLATRCAASLALLLVGFSGCGRQTPILFWAALGPESTAESENTLRIATRWSSSQRARLVHDFQDWQARSPGDGRQPTIEIAWIEAPPAWTRRNDSGGALRADVLLGGPLVDYVRLSRLGRLESADASQESRSGCHVLPGYSVILDGPDRSPGDTLAFDDPRVSPAMLAWCQAGLKEHSWREGYARLIHLAGRSAGPVGWRPGSARDALDRDEAAGAILAATDSPNSRPASGPSARVPEGVAIVADSPRRTLARRFLRFLTDRRGATPLSAATAPDPDASELLADLLGATMVDSLDELQAAWDALGGVESAAPSPARTWITEPPPWPPASIEKLLSRGGDRGLAMAHDLAGQLAPDPELRFWIIQSWLRPRRFVDDVLLSELSNAVNGRLVREVRFRSWLRTEWTAWARQRYRRVARLAAAAVPSRKEPVESP